MKRAQPPSNKRNTRSPQGTAGHTESGEELGDYYTATQDEYYISIAISTRPLDCLYNKPPRATLEKFIWGCASHPERHFRLAVRHRCHMQKHGHGLYSCDDTSKEQAYWRAFASHASCIQDEEKGMRVLLSQAAYMWQGRTFHSPLSTHGGSGSRARECE